MFSCPTVTQRYCRTVQQRHLKAGALPWRAAGVSGWSWSSFLCHNLGPVWTNQKRRPLLVREQTEWVSSSYLLTWNEKPHMPIILLQLWSLGRFPVCSQMRRSGTSAMWPTMTFLSRLQVRKKTTYKIMCSSGTMVNMRVWLTDKTRMDFESVM